MVLNEGPLDLRGSIEEADELAILTIDDVVVEIDDDGRFEYRTFPRTGINVHEVAATDRLGNTTRTVCSYFAADAFHSPIIDVEDITRLALGPEALDDGDRDGQANSLADIVDRVIDSNGWVAEVGASLRAQNPVFASVCLGDDERPPCAMSLSLDFEGLEMRGARNVTLRLAPGGIEVGIHFEDVVMQVRGTVETAVGVTPLRTSLVSPSLEAQLIYELGAVDGRPNVDHRSTRIIQAAPVEGELVSPILADRVDAVIEANRDLISERLLRAARAHLEQALDGLLSTIFSGFTVPDLADQLVVQGFGPVQSQLEFRSSLYSFQVDAGAVRMAFATRVLGPSRHGGAVEGIPVVGLRMPGHDGIDAPSSAAIDSTLFNQVLHALWRAGHFHFENANGVLGLGEDTTSSLRLLAPPTLELRDGIEGSVVHIGPLVGHLERPEEEGRPIGMRAWARLRVFPALHDDGQVLQFEVSELEDFWFEMDPVDPLTRVALRVAMTRLVPGLVTRAINEAVRGLPIPEFRLPAELQPFGFRQGLNLRLVAPQMTLRGARLEFEGNFGQ
jgi:hypothetical protein